MGKKNKNKKKKKNPRQSKIERTEPTPPDIVSSSSEAHNNEGKNIYFCVRKKNLDLPPDDVNGSCPFLYEWYAIKLSSPSDTPTLKTVFAFPPVVTDWGATIVASDSVIYVLCGNLGSGHPIRRTADVFYFDTRLPDEGWRKGPSMMLPRLSPVAFVVDGKIYVFNGVPYYEQNIYPFSEFFDPQYGRWEPNSVPVDELSSSISPVYDRNGELLFDVINNESFHTYRPNMCVVGDVLFCYNDRGNFFSTYHLVKRKWLSDLVWPDDKENLLPNEAAYEPHLLHIGNDNICLAWSYPIFSKGHVKARIVCTIFTVWERPCLVSEEGTSFVATIISHSMHVVDGDGALRYLVQKSRPRTNLITPTQIPNPRERMGKKNKNKQKKPRQRKIEGTEPTPPDIVSSSSSWIDEKSEAHNNEGKNIYFCVEKQNLDLPDVDGLWPFLYEWYATKLSSPSDTPTLMAAFAFPPEITVWGASIVALDSVIYVLGGNLGPGCPGCPYLRSADVFYFDTRRPDEGWKKGPSMIQPRLSPLAFVVDGKIYVFKGIPYCEENLYPLSEFFDPQYGRWEPNSVPIGELSSSISPVYDSPPHDNEEVWFHVINNASLHTYWPNMCVVGDVLYCYNEGCNFIAAISAYHLVKRKWYSRVFWRGLRAFNIEDVLPHPETASGPHLLHIGNGNICLAWSYPFFKNNKDRVQMTRIVRTIFTVGERPCLVGEEEGTSLVATIISNSINDIDCYGSCIRYLVL